MTYWQWLLYQIVTSVIVGFLYGIGYLVWKTWIEDWAENRPEKKHHQTLLDK